MTREAPSARPLWAATATSGPQLPALQGDLQAEVAVIGAGYTGLSAALHLLERGCETAVIDALEPGERASGLNGGQVIAGVKHDPDELLRRLGPQLGSRVIATVGGGPDLVFDLIARHRIDCQPVRRGWIQAASTARELAAIHARASQWHRHGVDAQVLGRAQMLELTGSEHYCGGWLDPRGGSIQPLSYLRGLAHAVVQAGGRICVRSRALRLERRGAGWRIGTARGSLAARKVILATGADTDGLVAALRRSLITVPSFQLATAPIPSELRGSILPHGHCVSDTRALLRYFRLDADGRLLIGSRGQFDQPVTPESTLHLLEGLRQIYPRLERLPVDYRWGGLVDLTVDQLPHLHEIAPRLFAGVGFNGRGIAMATMFGSLLARLAAGTPAAELGFPVTPLRPFRLHRLARAGARAAVQLLRLRERWQQWRGA